MTERVFDILSAGGPALLPTAGTVAEPSWEGDDMADATCSVGDCDRAPAVRGWCRMHYKRWQRTGDPLARRKLANGEAPDTCTAAGCLRPYHAKGFCSVHYGGLRYHGDPLAERQRRCHGDLAERLSRVEPQPDGCVYWTGAVTPNGYGQVSVGGGVTRTTHVAAYELHVGPVPDGLDLDHVCHNRDVTCPGGWDCMHRRCMNVDHLEPVTRAENMRRAHARIARTGPQ